MKSKIKFLIVLLGIVFSSVISEKEASAQQANVSFQVFYDELSPYGQWLDHPNYGYIWLPDAGQDFVPYSSNGYWVLSSYGWTWVSNFIWGWAPFHYGRWDYDNDYGWFWLPDNQWGPAWVTWRRANGYYGWSPMRPGISISLSFGRHYDRNRDHWIFVRDRDLQRRDISRYHVGRNEHDRIIRNSSVINRTHVDGQRRATYVAGPDRMEVQRVAGRNVRPVSVRDNNRPGQSMSNGELQLYRPKIRVSTDRDKRPVPREVARPENVRQHQRDNIQPQKQNDQQHRQNIEQQRKNDQQHRQNVEQQKRSDPPQRVKTEKEKRLEENKERKN